MRRPHANPIEEKNTQLEWKLYQARETILILMPEGVQEILRSYRSCASRDDANQWNHTVVEKIISLAEELPSPRVVGLPRFAKCPLCGSGSMAAYQPGFTLPEGLRRHLVGWGNARQCGVFHAVSALARDCWNNKFSAAEEAEADNAQARTALRKRLEVLYRVAPDLEPRLIDDGLDYGAIPRDADGMKWADERLKVLGFEIVREGAVKSYLSERGDFVVYADPREHNKIRFTAYKKPLPKVGHRGPRLWALNSFSFQDRWTIDIKGKFERRLAELMSSMNS